MGFWEDFKNVIRQACRLLANLTRTAAENAKELVVGYYRLARGWLIRLFFAALAPLIIVVPCLMFGAPVGWLYGAYIVWLVLLLTVGLLLISPVILFWRRVKVVPGFHGIVHDLGDWTDFIRTVLAVGLSFGIFAALFPIWRSPGTFPLLLLVLVCWLALPACAFSNACKKMWPTLRSAQLLLLGTLLLLQMAFPQQLDDVKWLIGRWWKPLIAQKEVTAQWKTLIWFDNSGRNQVWYSDSDSGGFRLWAARGYDPDTGVKLQPVANQNMKNRIVADFTERERMRNAEAEAARQQKLLADQIRMKADQDAKDKAAEEKKRREDDRLLADQKEQKELERYNIIQREAEAHRKALEGRKAMQRKYLLLTEQSLPSNKPLVAVVAARENEPDLALTQAVSQMANRSGFSPVNHLFKKEFVSDGLFDSAFNGDFDSLSELDLTNHCEFLLLCLFTTTAESRPEGQAKAIDGKLRIKLFRCGTGALLSSQEHEASAIRYDSLKAIAPIRDQFVALLATNSLSEPSKTK